jgi:hypothetical protein
MGMDSQKGSDDSVEETETNLTAVTVFTGNVGDGWKRSLESSPKT